MTALHIVHLTTVHPRGDTRIFLKQAQTLAVNLPHKVWLVVADGRGDAGTGQGGVSICDVGRSAGGRLGRALVSPVRAFFCIRKLNPAIVHFHDPELIPLGLILKLYGHKVIYDVHEHVFQDILDKDWIPGMIRRPAAWAMNVLERVGAESFDAIVPATPKITECFPAHKTVVVQNFPYRSELVSTNAIPYEKRPRAFAYVGSIAAIRGASEMVQALADLDDYPDVRLEMAGDFSPAGLKDELRAIPSWSSVICRGHVARPGVAEILGRARAGLVLFHPAPYHIDAQPNKMFEYMAASIPVIASDFPLWRQIIGGARCGLLVDPQNPKAIAGAMRWILEHPAEAGEMGRRGQKAVEDTYNWDKESVKLLALYERLLGSKPAAPV